MPLKKDKFHHLLHEGCGSLEKSREKTPGHFWSQKDTSMTQYMVFGVKVKLFWSLAPKSNSLTTATRWWNCEPNFQFCYIILVSFSSNLSNSTCTASMLKFGHLVAGSICQFVDFQATSQSIKFKATSQVPIYQFFQATSQTRHGQSQCWSLATSWQDHGQVCGEHGRRQNDTFPPK